MSMSHGIERGYSGGYPKSSKLGSAVSNITAPLNVSDTKEFGFHKYFSTNFEQSLPMSESNKRNAGHGFITNLGESPLTRKQKQLQEFTINLKQGAI